MINWSENLDFGIRTEFVNEVKNLIHKDSGNLSKVILFGSTARNDFNESSDIDICFESLSLSTGKFMQSTYIKNLSMNLYALMNKYGVILYECEE